MNKEMRTCIQKRAISCIKASQLVNDEVRSRIQIFGYFGPDLVSPYYSIFMLHIDS